MSSRRSQEYLENTLLALALLYPLVRFVFDAKRGIGYLLHQRLADDAFYYFEISKHIPQFNLGIPNSGFHPLYAFVISPIQSLFPYDVSIPASLFLLVVLFAVGGIVIFRILTVYWPRWVALIASVLWLTSPKLYSIAVSGLETIMATTLILVFFLTLRPLIASVPTYPSNFRAVGLGLLAGLSFLARMDSPLILMPSLCLAGLTLLRERKLVPLAFLTTSTVILPAAWLSYVYSVTGDIIPTSSAALRALRGINTSTFPPIRLVIASLMQLANSIADFFVIVPRHIELIVLVSVTFAGALAVTNHFLRRKRDLEQTNEARLAIMLLLGTGIWVLYYVAYQGGFRQWYFAQIAPAIFIILVPTLLAGVSMVVSKFLPGNRSPLSGIVRYFHVLAAMFLGSIAIITSLSQGPFAPQEYDKYMSAIAANSFIPADNPEARIGAFNTGIYNYFMNADVINLDGVVNPGALHAIEEDRLEDYLASENIRYLIEHDIGEAANLYRLQQDGRIKIEKWIDLTEFYAGWGGQYAKHTFLWKVTIPGRP